MDSHTKAACSSASLFKEEIKDLLQSRGKISVATYMDVVNSHYYATRDPFGAGGDFITAPEISQLFGEVVALSFIDFLERRENKAPISLVELGPGRGTLMADFLGISGQVPGLLDQISEVILVDISPVLKAKQQESLKPFQGQLSIRWCDSLDSALESRQPTFIIANEFLDALPIHQYRPFSNNQWQERKITLNKEKDFIWTWEEIFFKDISSPEKLSYFPKYSLKTDIVETSPARFEVFKTVLNFIEKEGGQAIFIDYGDELLNGETLQALHQHRFVSILDSPGEADLTSHVDFGVLLKAAKSFQKLRVTYETQRQFLKRFYIDARLEALLRRASLEQKQDLLKGAERLTNVTQMGQLFKVLSVFKEGS